MTTTPARVGAQSIVARRPRPAPITVTEDAARRIAEIIAKAPQPAAGVRLTTP